MQDLYKKFLHTVKKPILVFFLILLLSFIVLAKEYTQDYNDPVTYSKGDLRWCLRYGVCTFDTLTVYNLSVIGDVFNVTMNLVTWNITENFNVGGNLVAKNITADLFGDGTNYYNIEQLALDTNASTACDDDYYLDGNGLCIHFNNTVSDISSIYNDTASILWENSTGVAMLKSSQDINMQDGDISIKDSDGEYHNISRDLQISDEMNRNITLSGLNGTLGSDGNLTITTITGENIAVNIDKSETILNKNSDSIIITSGTNESPTLNHIVYTDISNPVLTKRTTISLKSPSVAAFLQGANFTYVSAIGLATIDNLVGGLFNRFFRDGSTYRSGFDFNVSTNMVNISTGVISFLFDEIEITSNHSTSELHAHVHENGSFHQHFTIDDDDSYNDGTVVSNNKFFNAVFGIAITHDGAGVMYTVTQDLPSTEYTKVIDAEIDIEDTINFFPSDDLVSLAYIPIVRVVIRRSGGVNTIQTLSNGLLFDDLRGTITKTSSSPPPSGITAHLDLTNLDFASSGHTGFLNNGSDINVLNINATSAKFYGLLNASQGIVTPNITVTGIADINHSLQDAYDDGSVIQVDDRNVIWNVSIDGGASYNIINDFKALDGANEYSTNMSFKLTPFANFWDLDTNEYFEWSDDGSGTFKFTLAPKGSATKHPYTSFVVEAKPDLVGTKGEYANVFFDIWSPADVGGQEGAEAYFTIRVYNGSQLIEVFKIGNAISEVGVPENVYPLDLRTRGWIPLEDNKFDIGSPEFRFRNGYFADIFKGVSATQSIYFDASSGLINTTGNVTTEKDVVVGGRIYLSTNSYMEADANGNIDVW